MGGKKKAKKKKPGTKHAGVTGTGEQTSKSK